MTLAEKIRDLAAQYADRLKNRIDERVAEMQEEAAPNSANTACFGLSSAARLSSSNAEGLRSCEYFIDYSCLPPSGF